MINNLKKERKAKKLKQCDLADALGVSSKIVYNWEKGKSIPSIRFVLLISKVLDIPVERLYSIDDEVNS